MAFLDELKKTLLGSPAQMQQLPLYNQGQQDIFKQLGSMGLSGLQSVAKPFDFAPIEQQARSGFSQKTVPSIAERFSSVGGQGSSGFRQALGQAGAGLEESLAGQKANIGLQQQGQLQSLFSNLLGMGLTPQFQNVLQPREAGVIESVGAPILQGAGSYFASGGNPLAGLMGILGGLGGGQQQSTQQFQPQQNQLSQLAPNQLLSLLLMLGQQRQQPVQGQF